MFKIPKLVGTPGRGKRTLFLFMFNHLSKGQDVIFFFLFSFLFSAAFFDFFRNLCLASNLLLLSGGHCPRPPWTLNAKRKRANKMTTNHIYFCFSPHFWLRINLDCLLNGDYINFNSGFSRMKSRSSRTTLWCLIVIIRKCFVSRCPNMYTARYGKTVRAWLERAALRLSNALARARAQAKKPNAALTANRDARARAEPRQITCVKIVDLLSNITMLWNLN